MNANADVADDMHPIPEERFYEFMAGSTERKVKILGMIQKFLADAKLKAQQQ